MSVVFGYRSPALQSGLIDKASSSFCTSLLHRPRFYSPDSSEHAVANLCVCQRSKANSGTNVNNCSFIALLTKILWSFNFELALIGGSLIENSASLIFYKCSEIKLLFWEKYNHHEKYYHRYYSAWGKCFC